MRPPAQASGAFSRKSPPGVRLPVFAAAAASRPITNHDYMTNAPCEMSTRGSRADGRARFTPLCQGHADRGAPSPETRRSASNGGFPSAWARKIGGLPSAWGAIGRLPSAWGGDCCPSLGVRGKRAPYVGLRYEEGPASIRDWIAGPAELGGTSETRRTFAARSTRRRA